MSGLENYLSLEDFERGARRRLPRPVFHYIHDGVESDRSLALNRSAFDEFLFVPRVLRNVSHRRQDMLLFDRTYAAPFGIAPMGVSALSAYRGDLALADAARLASIPMIVSATSLIPLEEIRPANPDAWFQAYLRGEDEQIEALLTRVERAGFETLVATVDIPVMAVREKTIRAGFSTPLRPSPRLFLDGITRPRWLIGVLARTLARHGMPHFENSSAARGAPLISSQALRDFSGQSRFDWDHVRRIRDRWRGRFVLKGLLSPEDIALARRAGIDGVIASNHGGRQLDSAITPMLILPELIEAAAGMPVMVDGGFRRGTDIVKALCLGATLVFVGRPFAYAAALGGRDGALRATGILQGELERALAMLGHADVQELDGRCLRRRDGSPIDGI